MHSTESKAHPIKPGQRHPLLLQQRMSEQLFWPCLLIIAVSVALLVWNPEAFAPYRHLLMVVLLGTGMILILTFIYRLRAYAQCREHELCLRLPLSQLVIPYTEIRTTRPTELHHMFPPEKQRWTQRNFLGPLLGRTVVVVEMERMPLPPSQLRRQTGKYMVSPDGLGIVVPVRDWMRFRTELDEAIARSQRTSKLAIS